MKVGGSIADHHLSSRARQTRKSPRADVDRVLRKSGMKGGRSGMGRGFFPLTIPSCYRSFQADEHIPMGPVFSPGTLSEVFVKNAHRGP